MAGWLPIQPLKGRREKALSDLQIVGFLDLKNAGSIAETATIVITPCGFEILYKSIR
jgi:hypothetical protein